MGVGPPGPIIMFSSQVILTLTLTLALYLTLSLNLTITVTKSNNSRGGLTIMTGHYSCCTPESIIFKVVGPGGGSIRQGVQ